MIDILEGSGSDIKQQLYKKIILTKPIVYVIFYFLNLWITTMDIIHKYSPEQTEELSLVYLAKPIYGGWVTFTTHLVKKPIIDFIKWENVPKKVRSFGYGVDYQNVSLDDLSLYPIY